MKHVMTALALLVVPGTVLADEVLLENGGKVVGIARAMGEVVVVDLAFGTVTYPKSDVIEIVPTWTVMHEYQDRLANIGEDCRMESLYDLALWAQARDLTRYVNDLLRQVIALEPDHVDARALLGYVSFQGQWITSAQWKKETRTVARGSSVTTTSRKSKRLSVARQVVPAPYALGLPAYHDRGARSVNAGYTDALIVIGPVIGFSTPLPSITVRR